MAQFDIYRNRNTATRRIAPYLLEVQSDLLAALESRVVVPLVIAARLGRPAKGLNPRFTIDGVKLLMATPEIAGVSNNVLGRKISSAQSRRREIMAALELLFIGI